MDKDTITCPLKDKLSVTGRTWTRVGWQFHRQCIEHWISALKWQSQGLLLLSLSVVSDSLWPHGLQHTGFLFHHHLPELVSVESEMRSNHLILYCLLLLLPSIFPSIRVFSSESVLHIKWPKYWSFSFSISPSNEYSGLISFRIDCLDLLEVQSTLKSLL